MDEHRHFQEGAGREGDGNGRGGKREFRCQGGDVGKDRVPFVRIDDVAFAETRQGLVATWLSGASIADGQAKGTVLPPGTGGVERRFATCGLAGDPESTPAGRAPLEAGIGLTFAAMGFTFARR